MKDIDKLTVALMLHFLGENTPVFLNIIVFFWLKHIHSKSAALADNLNSFYR